MGKHVLIVDDDQLMRRSLAFLLERSGYRASTAASGEDALALARRDPPDLILLDIGLPGMDGLDALHTFRLAADVPIIFVTARRRELDQVLGLELGADDYITKPFDQDILLARIKAVLRRAKPSQPVTAPQVKSLQLGDLFIDPADRLVTIAGRVINLSPREFDLLHALALDAGHALTTDQLLTQVWGAEFAGQPQVLYVHIRWLREKIEKDPNRPERILTVRGVGYRLQIAGEHK